MGNSQALTHPLVLNVCKVPTEKNLCRSLFFNKIVERSPAAMPKIDSNKVHYCEFFTISKNAYLIEYLRKAVSVILSQVSLFLMRRVVRKPKPVFQ